MSLRRTWFGVVLLAAGCVVGMARAADSPYQGQFAKAPMPLVTCAVAELMKGHPEMYIELGGTDKTFKKFSMSGAPTKLAALSWSLSAEDAGSGKSTAMLQGSGASAAELDELWNFVKSCGAADL
ncbi:hypothetical protein [Dongia sp.]|uniref:hypothetical protein n=1 Tax=Dongia sp. TaxID=1977262 RepID=UPI003752E467